MEQVQFNILLVDDDIFVAEILGDLLTMYGYQVEVQNSAQSALDRLVAGLMPNLVLSDIRMPGKNGIQLTAEIKLKWPNLKVILMTGFSDEFLYIPVEYRTSALMKPIDPRLLRSTVDDERRQQGY